MTDLPALADALRRVLGDRVGVGVADPRGPAPPLLPEEEAATLRMRAPRRREFAAGRAAARAAMAALNLPPAAIPIGADRAPLWPAGLCGSIAHCKGAAVAVVARQRQVSGLGIDIEEATDLPSDLWEHILSDEEMRWLRTLPPSAQGLRAKEIFCAKEAIHKLHHPLTGRMLEFRDVTVLPDDRGFRSRLPLAAPDVPDVLSGDVIRTGGFILTVLSTP